MTKADCISLDDIDATLKIFEIEPENQKPHPSFWDEVLEVITSIENLIARRVETRNSIPTLETLCLLRVMADGLKRQYDKNTSDRDEV